MDALLNLLLRWLHVVAGVVWIGHLYFFNFVNAHVAKTYDADSKKKVVPELMPRALYWFRWGAMYTWVSGILLFWLVYAMGGTIVASEGAAMGPHAAGGIVIVLWLAAFFLYDALWKSPLGKNEKAGAAVSYVLVLGVSYGLSLLLTGRALYIAVGGLFGTVMMMNVWMRIWPAQRKIITGIAGKGPAADASVPALAGLRSKHNTYMSVPLIFFMISNHFPAVSLGTLDLGYSSGIISFAMIAVYIALGWGVVKLMYNKSGSEAPKYYGATDAAASQAKAG